MSDQVVVSRELLRQGVHLLDNGVIDFWDDEAAERVIAPLRTLLDAPAVEPYGHVTVRRLSQRFENHVDQYTFYPAGHPPYLDNVDECITVYTAPQAQQPAPVQEPVAWGAVKTRPDGKRYCRAVATTDQSHLGYLPLFTAPQAQQPRKAVELSDGEFEALNRKYQMTAEGTRLFGRAIEQAVWDKLGVTP